MNKLEQLQLNYLADSWNLLHSGNRKAHAKQSSHVAYRVSKSLMVKKFWAYLVNKADTNKPVNLQEWLKSMKQPAKELEPIQKTIVKHENEVIEVEETETLDAEVIPPKKPISTSQVEEQGADSAVDFDSYSNMDYKAKTDWAKSKGIISRALQSEGALDDRVLDYFEKLEG